MRSTVSHYVTCFIAKNLLFTMETAWDDVTDHFPANGRIPAIVDKTSGKPKRVFEGASIQLYLCEKYDKDHKISFPYDSDEYWESVEWMVWMVSSSRCWDMVLATIHWRCVEESWKKGKNSC